MTYDHEAEKFYKAYKLGNGNSLPEATVREYTLNASILKSVSAIAKMRIGLRKRNKSSYKDVWPKLAGLVAALPRATWPHSLPKNARRLKDRATTLQKEGYESLIHKNFSNSNSKKLTAEAEEWALARWASQAYRCPSYKALWKEYMQLADEMDWKPLKDEEPLRRFLKQEQHQWYGHRYGELKFKEKYMMSISTKLPTMRDSLWFGDGTKINYYYKGLDGKRRTISVYEVMDVYSEVLLGYAFCKTEDYAAQYEAYKMAAQVAGHRPYEIRTDGQGGHKKLEAQNFLNRLSAISHRTRSYNGKSKTIESAFGRFQVQHLKKDWFWTGQNMTTTSIESQPNMEFIIENERNLPTLEELKEIYRQRRHDWNNAAHFECGRPRIERYQQSENPETPKIELLDMVDLFWLTREKPVKPDNEGIQYREGGKPYTFMVYDEAGEPDQEWLMKNVDKPYHIKYDPQDRSMIMLYDEDSAGKLRFVCEAKRKIKVHRGAQEREDGDLQRVRSILEQQNELRLQVRDSTEDKLAKFGYDAESAGLKTARIRGIETKKKGKKLGKDTYAQHLKKQSNTTNTSIYDEY